jgi:Uma2 family endonuclease
MKSNGHRNGNSGGVRVDCVSETRHVRVPEWVLDLESFRRWSDADDFPEGDRIEWMRGGVWIDMSREQLFSHVQVKLRFSMALGNLVDADKLGYFFPDGARFSNEEADLSVKPDGLFLSMNSLESKAVRLLEGMEEGWLEVEGSPEMVLEVVSAGSVQKDTVDLRDAYWKAGVAEYWLVDARPDPPSFDILRHAGKGYVAVRKQKGWVRSGVFGRPFRLTRDSDPLGHPRFTLEVR